MPGVEANGPAPMDIGRLDTKGPKGKSKGDKGKSKGDKGKSKGDPKGKGKHKGKDGPKGKLDKNTCKLCGKKGHWASECRSNVRQTTQATDAPQPKAEAKAKSEPAAKSKAVARVVFDLSGVDEPASSSTSYTSYFRAVPCVSPSDSYQHLTSGDQPDTHEQFSQLPHVVSSSLADGDDDGDWTFSPELFTFLPLRGPACCDPGVAAHMLCYPESTASVMLTAQRPASVMLTARKWHGTAVEEQAQPFPGQNGVLDWEEIQPVQVHSTPSPAAVSLAAYLCPSLA